MPVDQKGHWFAPATVNPVELHTPHPPGYIYQNPIPEPTARTPGELLNTHYGNKVGSRWTDRGVLDKQQETHRRYPQYAAFPIGAAGLVGRWPRPVDSRVPIPANETWSPARDVVEFDYHTWSWPKLGVTTNQILAALTQTLKQPNDIILKNCSGQDLDFVIKWPGYPPQKFTIRTRLDESGLITRVNLLIQITMAYATFFGEVEKECLLPDAVGFYNIALHQGTNAREDSLGVQLAQLRIIKCYPTPNGYFVAEVNIV